MRLTNYIREAFVTAAMADVPKIDYQEQATTLARESVRKLFEKDNPGIDYKQLEKTGWLPKQTIHLPGIFWNISAASNEYDIIQLRDLKTWVRLNEMHELAKEQETKLKDLKNKLKGAAASCTTVKMLRELLPEFANYLPAETEATCRTLPAVANIMSDFVKAGWPKQNQGKIAAAKSKP
jgi:hypothetical protein